ncbi:MAG: hypothetical protein QME71_02890 [Dehalococcoidia bacterium]|nr:hypothetical protein [Dehalococcoidia bacterium]
MEPEYYTRYPPLGLLKLASFHNAKGDEVEFHRGLRPVGRAPRLILVTSLFTYSWAPVHQAVEYYRTLYPRAEIRLGGIYATLMPEHAKLSGADEIHKGLLLEVERFLPDYSLTPGWDSSIMFGTRGCIRKCAFCAVPRLEGKTWGPAEEIRDLVYPEHRKVVLWDNNILGVPNWRDIVEELQELDVEVDFNQGLDARLIDEDVARELAKLRIRPIRMAYDIPNEKKALERAIPALEAAGFKRRRMVVYTLYNFTDTPADFLSRVVDLLSWGVVCYPMRYEPLNSLIKNRYVSPHWTARQLEMVAKARRVMGAGGAFPPYSALLDKFAGAASFEEAFSMRPGPRPRSDPEGVAGFIEEPTPSLNGDRSSFRELLNDPSTLLRAATCAGCDRKMGLGERAFALQDYAGRYVGYVCPLCHPNRKWINGLWRSVLGEEFSRDGHGGRELPVEVISRTVH